MKGLSKLALLFLLLIALLGAGKIYRDFAALKAYEEKIEELKKEIARLEERKRNLQLELRWLKESPEAMEYYIKERLRRKKKGEKVIVILESR